MLHVSEMMSMENQNSVELEEVPVHEMNRRIKVRRIRRKGKKTKKTGMKVKQLNEEFFSLCELTRICFFRNY